MDIQIELQGVTDTLGNLSAEGKFVVQDTESFSRLRLSLVSTSGEAGRLHSFSLSEKSTESGQPWWKVFGQVEDSKEELFCVDGGLLTAGQHVVEFWGSSFEANEQVNIKIELIYDRSDLPELTAEVIQEVQEDGIVNVVCAGISDRLINHLALWIENYVEPTVIDLPNAPGTQMVIKLVPLLPYEDREVSLIASIDPVKESIFITFSVRLTFYLNQQSMPFAEVNVVFSTLLQPMIGHQTTDILALVMKEAKIKSEPLVGILNLDELLQAFGTQEAFNQHLDTVYVNMTSLDNKTPESNFLPSIPYILVLPDTWMQFPGYRGYFQRFVYRTGSVNGRTTGFLFVVLSVHSLLLPPSCLCLPETTYLKEEEPKVKLYPKRNRLDSLEKQCYFMPVDRWYAFGLSQQALNEIVRPLVDRAVQHPTSRGGSIRFDANYWVQIRLQDVKITRGGLKAIMETVEGGGYVSGKIVVSGQTVASVTAGLKITFNGTEISWQVTVRRENAHQYLDARANASIDQIGVDIINTSDPIPARLMSAIVSEIATRQRRSVEVKLADQLNFQLLDHAFRRNSEDNFGLNFVKPFFNENQSLILVGEGTGRG